MDQPFTMDKNYNNVFLMSFMIICVWQQNSRAFTKDTNRHIKFWGWGGWGGVSCWHSWSRVRKLKYPEKSADLFFFFFLHANVWSSLRKGEVVALRFFLPFQLVIKGNKRGGYAQNTTANLLPLELSRVCVLDKCVQFWHKWAISGDIW